MRDHLRLLLVLLIVSALARVSYAQVPSEGKAAAGAPVAKAKTKQEGSKASRAVGQVAAVDPDGGTLRVKTKDEELLFTPGSKAARQSLQTLKVGDRVTVSYFEKEGYLVAPSITKSGRTAKPKTAAKKETKSETR